MPTKYKPKRYYLDNTIPADNTAQIGKQQVNRAKFVRYPKTEISISQGSKFPSFLSRDNTAARIAHKHRSDYYFSQAPTIKNLVNGSIDYLKANGYLDPTLSGNYYGSAPSVSIGKAGILKNIGKRKTVVKRQLPINETSEPTSIYSASPGAIDVTNPDVLRREATSYIDTGTASPWFVSLYGPFNRIVNSSLPKEVEREYKSVIYPRLVNAHLAEARYNTKEQHKRTHLLFTKKDATNIERMIRKAKPSLERHLNYDKVKNGYIVADGKLWDMYNAPTNGRAVAYNIRDLMAIDERELFNINRYIGHEFRHRVDNFLHRTKLMQRLLDKAYGAKFLSIPDRYPGYRKEYNMKPEQVTINRDLRHAILSHAKFTPDILQQNQIIENAHPYFILDNLEKVSGYGSKYRRDIDDFVNSLSTFDEKQRFLTWITNHMKNAMKYVGVGSGIGGSALYNSYDKSR